MMALRGGPPPPGFRQLSVLLVDCLKEPADPGPAGRLHQDGDSSAVARKTPGPNGWILHPAAEQSYASIEVELEEEEDGRSEDGRSEDGVSSGNPQQADTIKQEPHWGDTDTAAQIRPCEDVVDDYKDPDWKEGLVSPEDGVVWLILSESLKTEATLDEAGGGDSAERRQEPDAKTPNGSSDDVATPEQPGAAEASEPGAPAAAAAGRSV
ncbi:hypothetical protein FQN60_017405 [Etheostoma spectabile]|uniref:Uncharacterized protein n=1 Tax=Etheostoma spectabile TaxID=54343 RepID=A0A5J5DFH4_9PERO|nr:hypothetical protein FQN60_017405 [Etheostoma spectabile]